MPGRQKIDTHRPSREGVPDVPARHGIQIKIVRESGEVLGTVPNAQAPRWDVVETAAPGSPQRPIVWQVAHGETPDSVRNHPALKGLTIPRTGQSGAVGALVTKTLVVATYRMGCRW